VLIAQALLERFTIVTRDQAFALYGIEVLDC
jgi:PIN domain nuclease of toxin-antitoxin system